MNLCKNHSLQSNQFVGRPVKEQEEKDGENHSLADFHI